MTNVCKLLTCTTIYKPFQIVVPTSNSLQMFAKTYENLIIFVIVSNPSVFHRFAESREGGPQLDSNAPSGDPFMSLDPTNLQYYEPHPQAGGPWFDIIDIEQVLSFLPVVPNFEQVENTIPRRFQNRAAACFPVCGAADGASPGTGSKLWYVNGLALLFGSRDKMERAYEPAILSQLMQE